MSRADRIAALHAAARERILVLDGAWGVMIQRSDLSEDDFRGARFTDHVGQMKGNNDILCLTRPDIVSELHDQYFAAGAEVQAAQFALRARDMLQRGTSEWTRAMDIVFASGATQDDVDDVDRRNSRRDRGGVIPAG